MLQKMKKYKLLLIGLIVLLISILSISNYSMWGDEICRVFDPISGNFINTLKTSLGFAQPGYMIYMYLWERITFSTNVEFFIRCSNLIFVPIAFYYVYKIVKYKKWNLWIILLFFMHPMFIYYMDEATPYIIVYTLSLAFIYYTFFTDDFNSTSNIVKLNIVYLIGVFFHFIFGFIIIPYIVNCLMINHKDKKSILKHIYILLLFSIIYVPLLVTYLLNLIHVTTGFSLKNIAYVIYSFIGMAGIGLSRNDLRALNFNKINSIQIICLLFMIIVCVGLLYFIIKNIKTILKKEREYLICILAYFVIIFGLSFVIKFGVWERHCFSIFPLFLISLIDILYIIKNNKKSNIFIALYIIILIFSSINIRYNYYYQSDDFKGVYEYIEEISPKYVILNYETSIYDITKTINKENISIIDEEEKIKEKFNEIDEGVLILFEKNSSDELYEYFDSNYKVINEFNSFKIIVK